MPKFLIAPKLRNFKPSWDNIFQLAREFRTSKMATAFQIIEYIPEPCALVYSENGKIKWTKNSHYFCELGHFIEWGTDINRNSCAFELEQSGDLTTSEMLQVSASTWLSCDRRDYGYNSNIYEDSWRFESGILTMIYVKDDI